MKIKISRASARSNDPSSPCKEAFFESGFWWVEINTLEEFFSLKKSIGKNLIVGTEDGENDTPIDITIYDDYIE